MGASIFSAIESPIEREEIERLREKKADFLQNHRCITGIHLKKDCFIWGSLYLIIILDTALNELIEEIVSANNRGVSLERNGSAVPSWSFGQSFFFSSTVVTTIGNYVKLCFHSVEITKFYSH